MIGVTCPRCKQHWFRDESDAGPASLCHACARGRGGDPLPAPRSPAGEALRDLGIWALVLFATVLGGLWLGMSLGVGRPAPPEMVLTVLSLVPLSWFVFPQVLIAVAVTLVAWYLPLRIDLPRLRIVSASVTFVAWVAIAAWVFSSLR